MIKTKWKENDKQKFHRGTTVVELLVYMALLTIFLVVLLDVFTTTLNFRLQTESSSSVNQDARYVLSKLSFDLYNADSVSLPLGLGDASSSLQLTTSGILNIYSLNTDGDLIQTAGGVSAKLNGLDTKITSISFKKLGTIGEKPTVQILMTVESRVEPRGGPKILSIQTTLGLR